MGRWLKRAAIALFLIAVIPVGYIGVSFVGALIPGKQLKPAVWLENHDELKREIIVISGLLHADFAFRVDGALKERLGFLAESGFPLNHPNLKYVAVGWGFPRNARPLAAATVEHRQPPKDLTRANAGSWLDGKYRRQLPCHRAAK